MRIPNREIRGLFKREVIGHLQGLGSDTQLLGDLIASLLSGEADTFADNLSRFLLLMASFHDTANRESFHHDVSDSHDAEASVRCLYHGLMLGLLATLIPSYRVVSNRESGYGRFDLAIYLAIGQDKGVIMEFKVADSEAGL